MLTFLQVNEWMRSLNPLKCMPANGHLFVPFCVKKTKRLADKHLATLREAKEAVRMKLEELNLRPFTAKDGCRRSAYMEEEQTFMRPLPSRR